MARPVALAEIKSLSVMLATGIKVPVGIKVPDTAPVYSEWIAGGHCVVVDIDRLAAAGFGLNIADDEDVVRKTLDRLPVAKRTEKLSSLPMFGERAEL